MAADTKLTRTEFLAYVAVYDLLISLGFIAAAGTRSLTEAMLLAAITAWLSSIVPMGAVGCYYEKRPFTDVFSPKISALQFLYGDSIFLPFALAMFAAALAHEHHSSWHVTIWWYVVAVVIGSLAGLVFHAHDQKNYDPERFNSPAKLVHDFTAYPLLLGGLVFLGVPALINGLAQLDWVALVIIVLGVVVGFGGWFWMGLLRDFKTGPDGRPLLQLERLHIKWRWTT